MSIPSNDPKKQRAHYSGKKKRHTLKSQILIHQPSGRFLSLRVAKGKVHDFRLWKETKIRLHPQVNLLADSGYEGIQKLKIRVEKPLKRTKKNPLKAEEKRKNRELSGRRIKVEHAIRRLKFFRLLSERYRNRRKRFGLRINFIAAYIDLNPVRAGMVSDPAEYRWSSYGEAVGGARKGNGRKARAGLVRACMSHQGAGFEAEKWQEISRIYRRAMGLALGRKRGRATPASRGLVTKNSEEMLGSINNETVLPELGMASMLRHRVRYFTDGAVIGSKAFVNEAFAGARERFTAKRKDGARRMRGSGAPAAGVLWSVRDLRVRVT